ncbi:MAG: hypothetical protein QXV35_05275 [Archaeoglobaceae archaeon]
MQFFIIPKTVDWTRIMEIETIQNFKSFAGNILKVVNNEVNYCLVDNDGRLQKIEHRTKTDEKGKYDELRLGNKIIKVREKDVEINLLLSIDEQRVLELAERIKELNKKREPHAVEFAKLWGEKEQKLKEIKRELPKQPIIKKAEDPSNPERPFYYYVAGYKDELTEEKRAKIAELEREIENIEEQMEAVRAKLDEIDNEMKRLIEENKDLINEVMTFFKETSEGREILYSEDPYDGFFGGEGLPESTAVILYAEYKILKIKKVRR